MTITPLSSPPSTSAIELHDRPLVQEPPMRIFLALWPSYETALTMMDWVRDAHAVCGGRMMTPETLHLTLAFLGATPAERVSALVSDIASWRMAWHALALTRFGRFEGPGVVWAGVTDNEDERIGWLDTLHNGIWAKLEPLGFRRTEQVFRPHVSLLRKAGPGDVESLKRKPLVWRPDRCVLVASQPGEHASRYKVLAQVPYGLMA